MKLCILIAMSLVFEMTGSARADYAFSTLDVPGAISTYPSGINSVGQIVGFYTDGAGSHGFLLSDEEYTSLDVRDGDETYAYGINNVGQIVGSYYDGSIR